MGLRVSPQEFVRGQSRALITILWEASHSCESGQVRKCAVENVMEQTIAFALAQLGYQKLQKEQAKVLNAFVGGRDVFAALPTGYAKFLCFALLPLIGRTVCPAVLDNLWCSLLSLMLFPWQRQTVQASIVSVSTWFYIAVACNYMPQIPPLHARIGPSPRPSLRFSWEGLDLLSISDQHGYCF